MAEEPKVKSCTCNHAYQDRRYGKGRRVHNEMRTQKDKSKEYRCTVCGTQRQ